MEPHVITQFADSTSLTIRAKEPPVQATMDRLCQFNKASSFIISEEKSLAYM
jgi:hypothetical protein